MRMRRAIFSRFALFMKTKNSFNFYTNENPYRKTCPCHVYPFEPYFYIANLGYGGVNLFFLFLLQNIDCGHSLEPPRRSMF